MPDIAAEQDLFVGDEIDPYDPLAVGRATVRTLDIQEIAELTVRERLQRRREAYCRVVTGSALKEDCEIVMQDLTWFCMGNSAVFHENERVHVLLTGRQEVWQRIQDHIRLSPDDLEAKYIKPQPTSK